MRAPRKASPAPKPATMEAPIEEIIQEILERVPESVNVTAAGLVERIFAHAPRPLSMGEIHRIASRIGGRPATMRSIANAVRDLTVAGKVCFAGIEMRPIVTGAMRSTPVYRKA